MNKLNARDRAQLVVIAYENGIVTPDDRNRLGPGRHRTCSLETPPLRKGPTGESHV